MYGVPYDRIPITRLSRLRAEDLARYKLIVVPGAWYVDGDTWRKLSACGANVLFTGGTAQYSDGGGTPPGGTRQLEGLKLKYGKTNGGGVEIAEAAPESLRRCIEPVLEQHAPRLPEDLGVADIQGAEVYLTVGGRPLLARRNRLIFITNRLLYACAYDPQRTPPQLGGSADSSANEADPWGLASSDARGNIFGEAVLKGVVEMSGALCRIEDPLPRTYSPWLGDHVERLNVTGNIVVNNDGVEHTVAVLCRRRPVNVPSAQREDGLWEAQINARPYDFVTIEYANESGNDLL
jgi:hypothetical protein